MKRPDTARGAHSGPRRRDVLAGAALAVASCARLAPTSRPSPRRFDEPIVVDIHCHDFNASDLPITGFLARTIPGLSDLSRRVTPVPELVLRKIIGSVHGLLNATTPTATEETAVLSSVFAVPATVTPVDVSPVVLPPASLPLAPIQALADQIAALFQLDSQPLRDGLLRLAETLYLVGHGRARIAATLATIYPQVSLFTPLLVDYDAWSDDHPASALTSQVPAHQLLAKLSIRGRIGRPAARFHPFIAFDPLRAAQRAQASAAAPSSSSSLVRPPGPPLAWEAPSPPLPAESGALTIVDQAVQRCGFVGVKVYPPVGFLPLGNVDFGQDPQRGRALDQALRALYAYCQTEEVPITTHASPANEYARGFHELAAPERWRPVLREFPRLRLNFGHFGHDNGAGGAAGVEAREAWMRQAAALIDEHANVFADLSGSPLVYDAAYATRWGRYLAALCARFKRLPSRLMYGSDWWLNRFEPQSESTVMVFARRLEDWLGARGRDEVMGRNALRFLGFLDDDGRVAAGNRNRERLRAFYGAEALPGWLA